MSASNARVLKMSDAETMQFLELYKNESVLWDTTMLEYKWRDCRKAAAKRIATVMGLKGFTEEHVIIKFKNLRSSYLQELKKIADSKKYGASAIETYIPKVIWFQLMDGFIRPYVKSRGSKSNSVVAETDVSDSQSNASTPRCLSESINPQYTLQTDHIKYEEELLQPNQEEDVHVTQQPSTSQEHFLCQLPTIGVHQSRKRGAFSGDRNKSKKLRYCKTLSDNKTTFIKTQLQAISEKVNNFSRNNEDSFDHFGKYVASLLRNMPFQNALHLQQEVISLILNANINMSFETHDDLSM